MSTGSGGTGASLEAKRYAKETISDRHPYQGLRRFLHPGVRVLDVGCGSGDLGTFYSGTGATFDGIEVNPSRAAIAAESYEKVDVGVYESVEPAEPYDLILFLDVLEHVHDPVAAMTWAAAHLKDGGAVITLVPNAAHWTARLKIARGDWSYTESGLFDRDHIHFFDTRTVGDLGDKAGLKEVSREYYAGEFPKGWRLRRHSLRRWPNLFSLHVLSEWRPALST